MRYLLDNIETIKNQYNNGKSLLVAVHLDGMLVPYSEFPNQVVVNDDLKKLLNALANKSGVCLAILSGRPLDWLKRNIRVENLYYVGNHGLEIESVIMKFVSPKAKRIASIIQKMKEEAILQADIRENMFIENKIFTFSIHCSSKSNNIKSLMIKAERIALNCISDKNEVILVKREQEIEVRPRDSLNSGHALNWIIKNVSSAQGVILPVVIGDPSTDAYAYEVSNKKNGVSVVVGKQHVNGGAQFYLKEQKEVKGFLEQLVKW